MKRNIWGTLVYAWRPLGFLVVTAACLYFLLFFRLGSLAPNYSAPEVASRHNARSLKTILKNPLYGPHKLSEYTAIKLGRTSPQALRFVSASWGVVFILSLYGILRIWHRPRIALLGTLLFASSSWFLHTARMATPDIMLLTPLVLTLYGTWLMHTKKFELSLILGVFILMLSLYIPGLVWLVMPTLIWQRKRVNIALSRVHLIWRLLAGVLVFILFVPLLYSFTNNPSLILDWLGLPREVPAVFTVLKDFIELPVELVARGPVTPERWLGQTPILDIFTTTMVLLGLYLYFYKRALDRVKLIGICILFGFVMVSLNGVSWITLILPFICMLSTAGIGLMLQQWFTVFPRNPLAKVVGLAFLTLTISMASYYQVSRYFVAWAEAPETKAIYSQNVLDE